MSWCKLWLVGGACISVAQAVAQAPCAAALSGIVYDEHDDQPLEVATLYLLGAGEGTYSESDGTFAFDNACPGADTLRVTHIGCEPRNVPVVIAASGVTEPLRITLEHHAELLAGVEVHAHRNSTSVSDIGATLSGEQLDRSAGDDFAAVVERLPGVRTVATGANVGRPVVDGLGGSRLQVVAGGIALATQDWGDEHALEVDPFAASSVQLARGGSTVRYGTSTTGASLVLDDALKPTQRGIHGQVLAGGASNARAVVGGASLAQAIGSRWGYRVKAAGRSAGDARAPDYVLSNTGARRASGEGRIYYGDSVTQVDVGYRGFYQATGILRTAHIGNLTDLRRALESEEPLIVRPYTREIDAPRQATLHHWFSANARHSFADVSRLTLAYSAQLNSRQEYDIRRGGRSATPSLDLSLTTHDVRAEYALAPLARWSRTIGIQATTAANRNEPGTGVLPFIPYYNATSAGAFAEARYTGDVWTLEASARTDRRDVSARTFSGLGDGGRSLIDVDRTDWLGSGALGATRYFSGGGSIRARLSAASRAPNPAERFADGVHHALAVIERGDTSLTVERGAKVLVGYSYEASQSDVAFHVSGFVHAFDNFIYADPLAEPELTIRGAFPVTVYRQGDAVIAGIDADAHLPVGPLRLVADASYLYGTLADGVALPDIAPLRGGLELSYESSRRGRLKDYRIAASMSASARQGRIPEQAPLPAPAGYVLAGLDASGHLAVGSEVLGVHLTVDNLFDVSYRDVLDRLRYYADRPGRDIQLRLLYDF